MIPDTQPVAAPLRRYAWVVALTFVALLASAGVRSVPGVLIVPLEHAFGWNRDVISLAAALGIFLFGLVGPFAAALMQLIGVRRTIVLGLAFMGLVSLASAWMTQPWQLLGTGVCCRVWAPAASASCWARPSCRAGSWQVAA